jgi:CubicO group peptidase (beta-lactamase class C family)
MTLRLTALALALGAGGAHATTETQLRQVVDQRLLGDRTGACLAVAVIEKEAVARTYACADPKDSARIDAGTAFEIGSVSKTMTAALLADLIKRGKASLDDPLAGYLPEGTRVPQFEGAPILLRHVVTHTSGLPSLPSRMRAPDPADPYADLDETALLASLGDVTLTRAPGSRFEYSNFASMVLSYAVARRAGSDLEKLLDQRLFTPLGMRGAYIDDRPEGVRAAVGHTPNMRPTPAWTFRPNLAGVGGVRATLDDMVRYVQAHLGQVDAPIGEALALSQKPVSQQPPMAMNWMLAPVVGRTVHLHEGGTGGFSSFVAFDTQRERGVVILSDTTWNSIGGLGSLGLHLVDASMPLGKPRKAVKPDAALLGALAGDYQLAGGPRMALMRKGDALAIHPQGQAEYEMGYDSEGDFYPLQFDAVLRPQRRADGSYAFLWLQGGGAVPATRVDATATAEAAATPSADELKAYEGSYALMPAFALAIRARDGQLFGQATGQGEFPLQAASKDVFEAPAFGIELRFKRDAAGEVDSLELHQGGRVMPGKRQ